MQELLFFRCDAASYAVDVANVDAIAWLPSLSVIDGVPDWFEGLVNYRGEPIPAINFNRLMGHPAVMLSVDQKILLLECRQARMALIVDQVDGIDLSIHDEVTVLDCAAKPQLEGFPVKGEVRIDDRLVMLLDVEVLIHLTQQCGHIGVPRQVAQPNPDARVQEIFQTRMHQLAQPVSAAQIGAEHLFAIVGIGARKYAIGLHDVAEFGHLQKYSPVPGCPAYVVGCINLRGDIISVIDLSAYLGLGRVSDAQDIVVLGSSGNKVGVLIKAVDRLVNANLQQVRAMREGDDHHPLAKNMLKEENDITAILDVPSLLTSKILEVSP